MKTSMTLKSMTLIALLGVTLAVPVLAQGQGQGQGQGMGMGGGPGMQNSGQGCGKMGQGMRGGRGGRGMQSGQNGIAGWSLMTPEERTAHQIKMRAVTTVDQCQVVQTEHRTAMEARAKEKGVTLRAPRQNACDNLKAQGLIK